MPDISIIIPVFNGDRFIVEAVSSLTEQRGVDIEIIVSDNHSSDRTVQVVESIGDRRIRVVKHQTHLPIFGHFKRSLDLCRSAYCMILCADDFLLSSDALSRAKMILDSNSKVVAVFSDIDYVTVDRKTIASRKFRGEGLFDPLTNFKASIIANRNMFGIPILFRWDAKVNFDDRLSYMADLDFAYRLGYQGQFYYLPLPLMANRYHRNNQTWRYFHRSYSELSELAEKHAIQLKASERCLMLFNWIWVAAQKIAFRIYCRFVLDRYVETEVSNKPAPSQVPAA